MKNLYKILLLFFAVAIVLIVVASSSYAIFVFKQEGNAKNKLTTGTYSSCEYKDGATWEFDYTGNEETFTVPCSGEYQLETWRAQGGQNGTAGIGGYGAYSVGNINLNSEQILYINSGGFPGIVKNGGYNGGGNSASIYTTTDASRYAGGGATHIATKSGLLATLENYKDNILIVSGGGGGAKSNENYSNGGHAGGIIGTDGGDSFAAAGKGGTQTAGGAGGYSYSGYSQYSGYSGSFGKGGNGYDHASGGGSGFYGGGGGTRDQIDGSGGGGSSYIGNSLLTDKAMYCYDCEESSEESTKTVSTTCTNGTPTENCSKQGNGYAKITLVSAKYKDNSNKLNEIILSDNELVIAEPTLTTSSNNTSDASGLYKSTATNDGSATYYFRGNVTNNYVSFAGQTWRIVRINEDGTVRLIMEDGINNNTKYIVNPSYNNYSYMYYSNSTAKTILESWYKTNLSSYSNYIVTGDYFCEQAKSKYSSSCFHFKIKLELFLKEVYRCNFINLHRKSSSKSSIIKLTTKQ